jgi:acyl carrier protein
MSEVNPIQRDLQEYFCKQAGVSSESIASLDLIAAGVLDSLLLTDLVVYIQTRFDVILQTADVTPDNFRSVARLADLIHQRRQAEQTRAA